MCMYMYIYKSTVSIYTFFSKKYKIKNVLIKSVFFTITHLFAPSILKNIKFWLFYKITILQVHSDPEYENCI